MFALAFRTPRQGIAVGGDFANPANGVDAVATTRDGTTWRNAGDLAHLGEDVAYLPGRAQRLIVTGESGEVRGTSIEHRRRPHLDPDQRDRLPRPRLHPRRLLLGRRRPAAGWPRLTR